MSKKPSKTAAPDVAVEDSQKSDAPAAEQLSRVESVRREIDRLFDLIHPSDWRLPLVGTSGFEVRRPKWAEWQIAPALNMVEKSASFVITAELPGLTEEDVEVKAASGMITIKGEKSEEVHEEDSDHHISERRFGRFQRTFRMPEGVDSAKIDASMTNGVLTVVLPKTKQAMDTERKIPVKKG